MRQNVDYAYLGNGVGVTKTHRGHRIFVYTKDFGLSPHIIMSGVWEWAIEHAILKLFSPGDTVIEVGCNMGYHTLAMCDQLGSEGRLYGFEANPDVFKLLRWSVDHNGFMPRATLYNHAVTQVPGSVQFTFDPDAVGGGHVASDGVNAGHMLTIPGFPLDQVLPEVENVALLRMDVEGFEPFVIRGAQSIVRRSPDIKIVVEWSTEMMGSRLDLSEFIDEMSAIGFQAWRIDGHSQFIPVPMRELLLLPHCEIAFSKTDLALLNPPPQPS
jgi:FkbM family methyltransferase